MQFKQKQLDNGLMVIAEEMPEARSLALGFFVRTGARDETAEVSGVSHFLEHMTFKGTDKHSALQVNLEFDQMGAKYNAFTSEENTVYYGAVLPEYQERLLALWCDLMRPALRSEDFEMEKGVICEEIAMYKDTPHFDVLDRCRRLHFGDHCCGQSVLGTTEIIKTMKCQQMQDYFNQRYSPDNMILACAGRFDWDALLTQADQLCNSWQPREATRELSDFQGTSKTEIAVEKKIVREHLCMISGAPSAQSPQRYAAAVLGNIVGDYTGSRLYWALVDSALADCADMEYEPMDGTGAFYSYISCDPDQTHKVIEIARNVFASVRSDGITDRELQASKNKFATAGTLNGELPMGRLVPLGYGWLYRKEYRTLAQEIEAIQAVTQDDIMSLLDAHPITDPTLLMLGPCNEIA